MVSRGIIDRICSPTRKADGRESNRSPLRRTLPDAGSTNSRTWEVTAARRLQNSECASGREAIIEYARTSRSNGLAFSCERQALAFESYHLTGARAAANAANAARCENPRAGRNHFNSEARRALVSCNALLDGITVFCGGASLKRFAKTRGLQR